MKPDKFNTYIFCPFLLNDETVAELKEMTETYPWFQLAWVLYAKNLKQIQSSEYEKVVKEVAIRVSNRKMLFNFLNSKETSKQVNLMKGNSFSLVAGSDVTQTASESLIDRFLSSDQGSLRRNSLGKLSTEGISHNEVLERSTTEDDELITETLANIYLQQKSYEKAIQTFEKLSLKYPEKCIYFASRIKEAEDLRNIN